MKTLKVLETAISNGLDNSIIIFFSEDKDISFDKYIGAVNANGEDNIEDIVKAGLFIWMKENFISIPDTIFEDQFGQKIAYYRL